MKRKKRITTIALLTVLILFAFPLLALAENITITSFAALDEAIARQTYNAGASITEPTLPPQIAINYSNPATNSTTSMDIDVTWVLEDGKTFSTIAAATFIYTASITDSNYQYPGLSLPQITVSIITSNKPQAQIEFNLPAQINLNGQIPKASASVDGMSLDDSLITYEGLPLKSDYPYDFFTEGSYTITATVQSTAAYDGVTISKTVEVINNLPLTWADFTSLGLANITEDIRKQITDNYAILPLINHAANNSLGDLIYLIELNDSIATTKLDLSGLDPELHQVNVVFLSNDDGMPTSVQARIFNDYLEFDSANINQFGLFIKKTEKPPTPPIDPPTDDDSNDDSNDESNDGSNDDNSPINQPQQNNRDIDRNNDSQQDNDPEIGNNQDLPDQEVNSHQDPNLNQTSTITDQELPTQELPTQELPTQELPNPAIQVAGIEQNPALNGEEPIANSNNQNPTGETMPNNTDIEEVDIGLSPVPLANHANPQTGVANTNQPSAQFDKLAFGFRKEEWELGED